MHLAIGKAAALLGVSVSTLRRWETDGSCSPTFRTSDAYAWVSSYDQKQDLKTQRKPGPKKLFRLIFQRQLSHLVINHNDRLLRLGAGLVFELCHHFGVEVVILESPAEQSFETELAADVIELMPVFSSRLYGRRSFQNRKRQAA